MEHFDVYIEFIAFIGVLVLEYLESVNASTKLQASMQ